MTMDNLLQHLSDNGYAVKRENLPALADGGASVAWYQHILLGVGVFVAFVCFLLLLFAYSFFDLKSVSQSIWAVIFIGLAMLLYRRSVGVKSHYSSLLEVFVAQVSFVLIITGKALLLFHLCRVFEVTHIWQVTLVAIVLAAVTFPLYPVMLSRFLSVTLLLFFAQLMMATMWPAEWLFSRVIFTLWFLGLLMGLIYFSQALSSSAWRYLRYAFVVVIFAQLLLPFDEILKEMLRIFTNINDLYRIQAATLLYPSFMIALVLCGWVFYLAAEKHRSIGVWLLCLALLLLAYFLSASLFFGLLIMVLGKAMRDQVMSGLGLALLAYALGKYYYDLQWSLLDKSLLLMASGGLLLLVALTVAQLPKPEKKR